MQFTLPDFFFPDLVSTFAFGLLAILLIIIGYIAFDKLTPKLDFDDLLNKGNVALAIVIGSFILGLCYVVGRVVSAVLGGGVGFLLVLVIEWERGPITRTRTRTRRRKRKRRDGDKRQN